MTLASLNGRILDSDEVAISLLDRGLLYGDGVFETLRAEQGAPLLFDEHMERLERGLTALGITARFGREEIRRQTLELTRRIGDSPVRVRLTITRGVGGREGAPVALSDCRDSTTAIAAWPLRPAPFPSRVRCCIVPEFRRDERSPLSSIKTLNYLPSLLARESARRRGFDEAVLTDTRGFLSEAAMANLFWLRGATLHYPADSCGALPGITAGCLRRAAGLLGLECRAVEARPGGISAGDLAFLTNAISGIILVEQLDATVFRSSCAASEAFESLASRFLSLYPMTCHV